MGDMILGLVSVLVGGTLGFVARTLMARMQSQSAERRAAAKLADADREAKGLRREAELQARSEVIRAREEFERDAKESRKELVAKEEKIAKREAVILQREENLDRKADVMDRKEQSVDKKLADLETRTTAVEAREKNVALRAKEAETLLQKLAGMTRDEARQSLFASTEKETRADLDVFVRRIQEELRETADRDARDILVNAMFRYAGSHISDSMTSTVSIGNDDVKGRIIGREGRNIRALESATGVSVLIDDTPGTVVLSGLDPIRREVARRVVEELVVDGRINPARIEEKVSAIQSDMDQVMLDIGKDAAFKADVQISNAEILKMLGRLKFRTSYSQNMLVHAIEVSALMGMIAQELGFDAAIARRVGLFHDIGKAMDHQVEGPHAAIGADFLRKHGESEDVVAGVAGHHDTSDVTPYAMICATADTVSAARPGARMEASEVHVQRMEQLEKIASSAKGVDKAYAVQSGREIRVIVNPDKTSDAEATLMARNISKKIESEMQFPGQIRVVVIREKRCVEYAR